MHLFYRNRLTRAYLGASQFRRPADPFTGFSATDDIPLNHFRTRVQLPRQQLDWTTPEPTEEFPYDGPYPIFGATLNQVRGKELACQTRKGSSFVFTPLYSGYDHTEDNHGLTGSYWDSAYRPTARFGGKKGPHLGTAMAISGAAASPNMGYFTTGALAFLMTVFNVRLGWWIGNPRHRSKWKRYGPALGLIYLMRELFPSTSDAASYIYLSDGGHFENLGIYELVRRQCRFIIASDGDCDPTGTFENLGSAVEKCRQDFGVNIEINADNLKHSATNRMSRQHFAWGTIRYRTGPPGHLLYIKASLVGDEPADVLAYAAGNVAFPHDTTANQFFTEGQFESYRALGQHIFRTIVQQSRGLRIVGQELPAVPKTIWDLFGNLEQVCGNQAAEQWTNVDRPLDDNLQVRIRRA